MKRFYASVSLVEEGGVAGLRLDDRPILTPAGNRLHLPNRSLAEAVAREWREAGEEIDLHDMHLTRLANSAVDRMGEYRHAVVAETARYIETELVCYRSAEPPELLQRQKRAWSPLIRWIDRKHGIPLEVTTSILPVNQTAEAVERTGEVVSGYGDFGVTGLHLAASATGSVVIALALAEGMLGVAEAWEAALVEELWQAEEWGMDAEAEKRRAVLLNDIDAASRFVALCDGA